MEHTRYLLQAFKSLMRLVPGCERCGRVGSMEHLLCECEHYLELLWNRMAETLLQLQEINLA
jgi:hypothetical protein